MYGTERKALTLVCQALRMRTNSWANCRQCRRSSPHGSACRSTRPIRPHSTRSNLKTAPSSLIGRINRLSRFTCKDRCMYYAFGHSTFCGQISPSVLDGGNIIMILLRQKGFRTWTLLLWTLDPVQRYQRHDELGHWSSVFGNASICL